MVVIRSFSCTKSQSLLGLVAELSDEILQMGYVTYLDSQHYLVIVPHAPFYRQWQCLFYLNRTTYSMAVNPRAI